MCTSSDIHQLTANGCLSDSKDKKERYHFLWKKANITKEHLFLTGKHDTTKAFLIISILLYGGVFMLLALAQFLKKEIFQKFIAPAFWFISKLNFAGDEIMADYVRTFFILL